MLKLTHDESKVFLEAVKAASSRSDVCDAIHNVYHALADAIELRKPICITSGRCCRFDEFGHKLFVTTMEMGTFLRDLKPDRCHSSGTAGGCPFQVGKLCGVHADRPFGCRVFFCDETAVDWQQAQYARFHEELKRLHERLQIPYFYVEWRMALQILGISGAAGRAHVISPHGL